MADTRSRNVNKLRSVEGKRGSQDKIAFGILPELGKMYTSGEGSEGSNLSQPMSWTDLVV